jgi:hypothetical protein
MSLSPAVGLHLQTAVRGAAAARASQQGIPVEGLSFHEKEIARYMLWRMPMADRMLFGQLCKNVRGKGSASDTVLMSQATRTLKPSQKQWAAKMVARLTASEKRVFARILRSAAGQKHNVRG